jgi:hypothetical protein
MNKQPKDWAKLYDDTVWSALQLIAESKQHIDTNNLIELKRVQFKLKADRKIIKQIYLDASDFYREKKEEEKNLNDKLFLEYCEDNSDGKAKRLADLATKHLRKERNELMTKKDKTNRLANDIKDIVINIAIIIRDSEEEAKHGS